MAIKKVSNIKTEEQALSSAPLIVFADQPSAIQVGPYVSKFTLGVVDDGDGEYPRPVVTIAMPTINLMRMVQDLQELFTNSEFREDSAKMLSQDLKTYFTVPGASKNRPMKSLKSTTTSKIEK
jgi:hypothetical protein